MQRHLHDIDHALKSKRAAYDEIMRRHPDLPPYPVQLDGFVQLQDVYDAQGRGLILMGTIRGAYMPASRWTVVRELLTRCPRLTLLWFEHGRNPEMPGELLPRCVLRSMVFQGPTDGWLLPDGPDGFVGVYRAFLNGPLAPTRTPDCSLPHVRKYSTPNFRAGAAAIYQGRGMPEHPDRGKVWFTDVDGVWIDRAGGGVLYEFKSNGAELKTGQRIALEWLARACDLDLEIVTDS